MDRVVAIATRCFRHFARIIRCFVPVGSFKKTRGFFIQTSLLVVLCKEGSDHSGKRSMAFGKRPNDSTCGARYGLPGPAMSEAFTLEQMILAGYLYSMDSRRPHEKS